MAKVKVDKKRCKGCLLCVAFCPKKNLKPGEVINESGIFPVTVVCEDACTGCGICYLMCPDCCIEIEG